MYRHVFSFQVSKVKARGGKGGEEGKVVWHVVYIITGECLFLSSSCSKSTWEGMGRQRAKGKASKSKALQEKVPDPKCI